MGRAQKVKNLPAMKVIQVQSPRRADPLKKRMDINKESQGHSSQVDYSP